MTVQTSALELAQEIAEGQFSEEAKARLQRAFAAWIDDPSLPLERYFGLARGSRAKRARRDALLVYAAGLLACSTQRERAQELRRLLGRLPSLDEQMRAGALRHEELSELNRTLLEAYRIGLPFPECRQLLRVLSDVSKTPAMTSKLADTALGVTAEAAGCERAEDASVPVRMT